MSLTLRASTGATLKVWRDGDVFMAERVRPAATEVQTCSPVDLFEIIAELAGLDLENGRQAEEAMDLAAHAERHEADDRCPGVREAT